MRVISRTSASYADSMDFLNIFGDSHKRRHRTERLSEEIGVKTCNYHSDAPVCQSLYYIYEGIVKELSFINTNHFHVTGQKEHACWRVNRCGWNAVGIVGYYLVFRVSDVNAWFVYLYLLPGKLCSFEPSDEFFSLSGEHGSTYNFN